MSKSCSFNDEKNSQPSAQQFLFFFSNPPKTPNSNPRPLNIGPIKH